MKRLFLVFTVFFIGFSCCIHLLADDKAVLVSVAPYVGVVRKIAGDRVRVLLLVPQGASFHSYEPSPKQLQEAASSRIWFCIGDPFEKKAQGVLKERNSQMSVVDLRNGLSLIHEHTCQHHDHGHDEGCDPHIWMSVTLMQKQVDTIYAALVQAFPDEKEHFSKGRQEAIDQLKQLDQQFIKLFQSTKKTVLFVSHPAYGYFCRDYGLSEKSIEQEGKDPGPRYITDLIKQAKEQAVTKIFVQPQYPVKAAHLLAKVLGAEVVMLDPYSEKYFDNMEVVAHSFHEALL